MIRCDVAISTMSVRMFLPWKYVMLVLVTALFISVSEMTPLPSSNHQHSSTRPKFNVTEEQPTGTFVADLKSLSWYTDADDKQMNTNLSFIVLTPEGAIGRRLFAVEPNSGIVRTATVVDRDAICRRQVTCHVDLDIGVQQTHKVAATPRIVKISVEILDINDNSPRFPRQRIDHSLSESTTPGVLFPLDLADDPDSPVNGVVRYQLVSTSRHFELQMPAPMSALEEGAASNDPLPVFVEPPLLVLSQSLDRELLDLHQLKIVAYDAGNPPRSGSILLDITVTDSNDNEPVFTINHYRAEVSENLLPVGPIATVSATDSDVGQNAAITYGFSRRSLSAGIASTFGIDSTSGQITLLRPLDYEQTGSSLTFDVIAFNLEPSEMAMPTSTARVTVKVLDSNDNAPEIRLDAATITGNGGGPVVSVPENSPPDTLVAHLSVTDPDADEAGEVTCSLQAGNSEQPEAARHFRLVRVDEEDYQLVTSSSVALDRETNAAAGVFRLTVTCRDMGTDPTSLTSSLDFRVAVADVDDNAPQFSRVVYNFSLNENAEPGTQIGKVSATDADSDADNQRFGGVGSGLSYHLHEDAGDYVTIHPETGVITSAVSFDHETVSVLRFHVLAVSSSSSGGDDSSRDSRLQSASALVVVIILNIDDESPTFTEASYEFAVAENQRPMTSVGHVTALDADSPPFDVFRYRFDGGAEADSFVIDPKSGLISTKTTLDRERKSLYRMTVYAESASLPVLRRGSADVIIRVSDDNDSPPSVLYPIGGNGTLRVPNYLTSGNVLTTILAYDMDEDDRLTFELTSVFVSSYQHGVFHHVQSSASPFRVDSMTGNVTVHRPLNELPDGTTYRLTISVYDSAQPPKSTTATLYLIIDRDIVGAEKSWSAGGAVMAAPSADGSGSNFRSVLENRAQLGVVVGVVAFSLVVICVLLAAILVCRRRRRGHLPAKDAVSGKMDGEAAEAAGKLTAGLQDGGDLGDEDVTRRLPISPVPCDWTKLPVDVISSATDIQPEPSPSWYGENQWTLSRTPGQGQGQGRFFQYDSSPARKDSLLAVRPCVSGSDPHPSTVPTAPSPPSVVPSSTIPRQYYTSADTTTSPYATIGKAPQPGYSTHLHSVNYCAANPTQGGNVSMRFDCGAPPNSGSLRGRVRFRESIPNSTMTGQQLLLGGDPTYANDPTVTSPPPPPMASMLVGGNPAVFQSSSTSSGGIQSTASPSILLRSRCLQPDLTASTNLPHPQLLTTGNDPGRNQLLFNRFKDC